MEASARHPGDAALDKKQLYIIMVASAVLMVVLIAYRYIKGPDGDGAKAAGKAGAMAPAAMAPAADARMAAASLAEDVARDVREQCIAL